MPYFVYCADIFCNIVSLWCCCTELRICSVVHALWMLRHENHQRLSYWLLCWLYPFSLLTHFCCAIHTDWVWCNIDGDACLMVNGHSHDRHRGTDDVVFGNDIALFARSYIWPWWFLEYHSAQLYRITVHLSCFARSSALLFDMVFTYGYN